MEGMQCVDERTGGMLPTPRLCWKHGTSAIGKPLLDSRGSDCCVSSGESGEGVAEDGVGDGDGFFEKAGAIGEQLHETEFGVFGERSFQQRLRVYSGAL